MNARSVSRLARLQQALAGGGTLHLRDAARLCGVSEMTIRRDIDASDGAMTLLGGRLVMADNPQFAPVYDLDRQQYSHAMTKRRLCERAAGFLADGDTLFVDCGTTLLPLVNLLASHERLTVVTYALNVANAVSLLPGVRLVLLGGLFHASSRSFGSDDMNAVIGRLGINRAFISAAGVHAQRGVSCFHFHEVAPKQAAIACAEQRLLVVDESKVGQIRPAYFAQLDDFDVVITDGDMTLPQADGGPRIVAA
ncbi:DeoR family transcriptional regulator [Billgrantia kenyensis]|uniref:DeoR family transcriptional regulator n=1 Tax=Billgrantia kenyensis TaxID=321266 RepID=A0A7W0AEK7_9GAMM|nr:DeoR family transcriptional regulator [Halomonas kenyensis]MBA2779650.1 DeoR family transcriptional regulator [Halomonas kenyensis]MCG6662665.1 DeoR family transcriptional regulator [Halomonas kenyensis]